MKTKFTEYEKKIIHTAIAELYNKAADGKLNKDQKEYLETDDKYVLYKVIRTLEQNNLLK